MPKPTGEPRPLQHPPAPGPANDPSRTTPIAGDAGGQVEVGDPTRPRLRGRGGKPLPSQEKARIRKNKGERTRVRDWTRSFLEGREDAMEEAETGSIAGKGSTARMRVFVPPAQRLVGDADVLSGLVTRIHAESANVVFAGAELPCRMRGKLKSFGTKRRTILAVGDRVKFRRTSPSDGVIEAVDPRTTVLSRADSKHPDREHVVVANVDQLVIAASMRMPVLKPRLIDRYLTAAVRGKLEPLICLNKIDLDAENERSHWTELYGRLGYRVIAVSAQTGEGIDRLRAALAGRISVFAGQSGTGKSSLLNAVQPGLNLRVGEINEDTRKGRHTTTDVSLLPLPAGGAVVDTPGIRGFGIWDLHPRDLEECFVEFIDRVAQCKFADCTHRQETGCAIAAAAAAGEIAPERYESYLSMYESLETGRVEGWE